MSVGFNLRRSVATLLGLMLIVLLFLCALSVVLVWHGARRLEPLRLEAEVLAEAQGQLLKLMAKEQPVISDPSHSGSTAVAPKQPKSALITAMETMSQQVKGSLDSLARAQADSRRLTEVVTYGVGLLLVAVMLLGWVMWHKAYRPLQGLSALLQGLARQDYQPYPLDGVDGVVLPIFSSYNRLVGRLARLEETHQARHEQMEEQVRAAAGALLAQRAELARVERLAALGEYAAALAHELRNPLAGLRAACRSLLEDVGDADTRERLGLITEEVERLVDLVNVQLRRARHDPEGLEGVDLTPLIGNIVALVSYQMPENVHVRVDLPEAVPARLPPNGFRQALLNLLRNAQRAMTGRRGLVLVRAVAHETEIEVCVEDDCPGCSEPILTDGIRRFVTNWEGGTGLGLAMVQRFAQELGGRLELSNREGGGARARIVIPVTA
jgi:two-component system, NtrC family, sensor kinase